MCKGVRAGMDQLGGVFASVGLCLHNVCVNRETEKGMAFLGFYLDFWHDAKAA